MGIYNSVQQACDLVIEDGEYYQPNKNNHIAYDKYYLAYKKLYSSLRLLFQETAQV